VKKHRSSANIILHNITSLHHLHSITSYIILHQQRKKGVSVLMFEDFFEDIGMLELALCCKGIQREV
jgi:hypothetical protein